jgi:hypothetical protein
MIKEALWIQSAILLFLRDACNSAAMVSSMMKSPTAPAPVPGSENLTAIFASDDSKNLFPTVQSGLLELVICL